MITGYTDPVINEMNVFPVFMGGDLSLNPLLSVDNNPVTKPANAAITMYTGTTNPDLTRRTVSWLENSNYMVQSMAYSSLYTVE